MTLDTNIDVTVLLDSAGVGKTSFGVPLFASSLPDDTIRTLTAISAGGGAGTDTVTFQPGADVTAQFPAGRSLAVYGLLGGIGNGAYTVKSVAWGAPNFVVTLNEDIPGGAAIDGVNSKCLLCLDGNYTLRYKIYATPAEIDADALDLGSTLVAALKIGMQQNPRPRQIALGIKFAADANWSAALSAIRGAYTGFYGFIVNTRTAADIAASPNTNTASAWAETNKCLLFAQDDDAVMKGSGTTDIGSIAKAAGLEYIACFYHATSTEYLDWAALCRYLAINPDEKATIVAYEQLSGVTGQVYTASEQGYMDGKYVNYYTDFYGQNVVYPGMTAKGRFIDLRLTADWVAARVREACAQLLIDAVSLGGKIPYTDQGFQSFGAVTNGVLLRGVQIGHFAPNSTEVVLPKLEDVDPTDRTARVLRFTFGAQPAGAVQTLSITGYVSINYVVGA